MAGDTIVAENQQSFVSAEAMMLAFCMGRHPRIGEKSKVRSISDDVLRKVCSFMGSWDSALAAWNMNFSEANMVVDINGSHRGTVVADVSFRKGIHYWEVTVADMRTFCVGVCEKPKNPRALCDKWLGEVGYAISVTSCSGGTAFLWFKEQLSTTTVKGFNPKERVGLLLDMEDRTLDYYVDGVHVATAFTRLPPGPMYPACSNGFDKTFCRHVKIDLGKSIPRDYFKIKDTRKAEQAKKDSMPTAKPGSAPLSALHNCCVLSLHVHGLHSSQEVVF
mmetsp:Transcript_46238/g.72372  ORF Transcript_46238/g.72372 Transcript_46238/m.72372 type:complete len:277 (+) Transcript_46238:135-965(+)